MRPFDIPLQAAVGGGGGGMSPVSVCRNKKDVGITCKRGYL